MAVYIYVVCCLFLVLGAIWVGVRYAQQDSTPESTSEKLLAERQMNAKSRRDEFGVSNRGTSMDDVQLNVIPYDDLGING